MFFQTYLRHINVKELFIKDQLQLVKEMMKASLINLPFQNITTFGAFLPMERKMPTMRESLVSVSNGEGGHCATLNNNMKLLLESIGYKSQLIEGYSFRAGFQNRHCSVAVKIPHYALKEGGSTSPRPDKIYLTDIGCGMPIHEPVDLDELPYVGRAGGLQYRIERVNETTLQRINECGDPIIGEKPSSFKNPRDLTIKLEPVSYNHVYRHGCDIFSNPRGSYIHRGPYCFRYLDITSNDFEVVCVFGTDLIFITKDTRHVQKFANYEQLKPSLLKYFPMINPRDVELAVRHFSIPFEEALKMSSTSTTTTS